MDKRKDKILPRLPNQNLAHNCIFEDLLIFKVVSACPL
jgi:hypothetical protein